MKVMKAMKAMKTGRFRQRGAEAEGEAMPLRLARTQPRRKQRGERPAHRIFTPTPDSRTEAATPKMDLEEEEEEEEESNIEIVNILQTMLDDFWVTECEYRSKDR